MIGVVAICSVIFEEIKPNWMAQFLGHPGENLKFLVKNINKIELNRRNQVFFFIKGKQILRRGRKEISVEIYCPFTGRLFDLEGNYGNGECRQGIV